MRILKNTASLALAIGLAVSGFAQSTSRPATLMAGDNAPPIEVAKWVKGTPVNSFSKGNIYVVEFWATWCGPCKVSIPHLTELQKKFADKATFIGVSSFENNWNGVEPFVQTMGDKMDYDVAMDKIANPQDREGFMAKNWMEAAKQNGIPTAFVSDKDNKVAWIGHPMNLEGPLTKVVEGTWDRESFAKQYAADMASQAARTAAADNSPANKAFTAYQTAVAAKNWKAALNAADAFGKLGPNYATAAANFRLTVYALSGNGAMYSSYGRALVTGQFKNDANSLNSLAWAIVDPDSKTSNKDYALAKMAAERAVEVSGRKMPELLDTLAWAYFKTCFFNDAATTEKEASDKAAPTDKATYDATIKKFQG